MNNMSGLRWFTNSSLMHQKGNMKAFNEKQVGRTMIASVLYAINDIELSIYKFLASNMKSNRN